MDAPIIKCGYLLPDHKFFLRHEAAQSFLPLFTESEADQIRELQRQFEAAESAGGREMDARLAEISFKAKPIALEIGLKFLDLIRAVVTAEEIFFREQFRKLGIPVRHAMNIRVLRYIERGFRKEYIGLEKNGYTESPFRLAMRLIERKP